MRRSFVGAGSVSARDLVGLAHLAAASGMPGAGVVGFEPCAKGGLAGDVSVVGDKRLAPAAQDVVADPRGTMGIAGVQGVVVLPGEVVEPGSVLVGGEVGGKWVRSLPDFGGGNGWGQSTDVWIGGVVSGSAAAGLVNWCYARPGPVRTRSAAIRDKWRNHSG